MRFYRAIWNNYHERDVLSREDEILGPKKFVRDVIIRLHEDSPNHASELWVVYLAFREVYPGGNISVKEVEEIHDKYWSRFHTYYWTRKKKGASLPHLPKTRTLKELLVRGFVHSDTITFSKATPYYIKCNIGPLVWFEAFSSQMEALEVSKKVGIPGWSGVPPLKN